MLSLEGLTTKMYGVSKTGKCPLLGLPFHPLVNFQRTCAMQRHAQKNKDTRATISSLSPLPDISQRHSKLSGECVAIRREGSSSGQKSINFDFVSHDMLGSMLLIWEEYFS